MESKRYDAVPLKATLTADGYIIDSPVLARTGVQVYRRTDGQEWREYRPPSAIFDPTHMAALRARPIIEGHVPRLDSTNARAHVIGTILSEGRQDGETVRADIIIHDPSSVLKGGKRELSLGYGVKTQNVPGVTPEGEPYDVLVESITMVDHLAIVPKGRAGVARLNLDADDAVSIEIVEEGPLAANLVPVRLDGGLSYDAPQEVAAALTASREAIANANRRADAAEAERDTLRTTVAGFDAERTQIRADAASGVRARLELEAQAGKHGITTRADMSDRAVREAVVTKLQGDSARFDGKSDDYVLFAFDHAVQAAATRADAAGVQRATVNGAGPARLDAAPTPAIRSAQAARDAMLRRG